MKRRAALLVTTMAVALMVASGVALAANINCKAGTMCFGTNKADTMTGTTGADDMRGRGGGDTLNARAGDDKAFGGNGQDDISTGQGNDPFVGGGAGDDSLSGGDGDDSYVFGRSLEVTPVTNGERWGRDTITNGETSGEDTLDFSLLVDPLDVDLVSSAGRAEVFSDSGMVYLPASVTIENVTGGEARDVIRGNDASNRFCGQGGNDDLVGNGNDDELFGGLGADAFRGGLGNDVLKGGPNPDTCPVEDLSVIDGDDVYLFEDGWGEDSITDAAGTDRLFFGELTLPVTVDLAASDTGVEVSSDIHTVDWPSTVSIENATGGSAADVLRGDGSDNTLNGLGGGDEMYGEGGNDTLYGRDGNDITMYGGPGADKVYGDHPNFPAETGDDTIDVADGDPGDTVDCGPGTDTVDVDAIYGSGGAQRLDTVVKNPDDTSICETVNEVLID
jgi:Ca2+-binding RTX toxin-like protein